MNHTHPINVLHHVNFKVDQHTVKLSKRDTLRSEVIHFHSAVLLARGETCINESIQHLRAAPRIMRAEKYTYPWPRSIRVGYRSHQLPSSGIIAPVCVCLV